tara:strand:- start:388 stop:975 length:588 start_codon:yes stop_codon:yes gene_type:complete
MIVSHQVNFKCKGLEYILRNLEASHLNNAYISFLTNKETFQYTSVSSTEVTLDSQVEYVDNINGSMFDAILGIYSGCNQLIGTVGFQNFNHPDYVPTIGILIASSDYRGRGLAPLFLYGACRLLFKENKHWSFVFAGIENSNLASIKSFQRIGFIITPPENYDPRFLPLKDGCSTYKCSGETLRVPDQMNDFELI